jgi:hypothetical protein
MGIQCFVSSLYKNNCGRAPLPNSLSLCRSSTSSSTLVSEMLSNIPSFWLLLAICSAIPVFIFYYIWTQFFSLRGLPKHLPWAGAGDCALSRAAASARSFLGLCALIEDGYNKVVYFLFGENVTLIQISTPNKIKSSYCPTLLLGQRLSSRYPR